MSLDEIKWVLTASGKWPTYPIVFWLGLLLVYNTKHMREAAERVAKELQEISKRKTCGVDCNQPPLSIVKSQLEMKDTILEELYNK